VFRQKHVAPLTGGSWSSPRSSSIVPFLTWYGTWFGRALSDEKIAEYLADEKNPRHIQHALTQIEARMEERRFKV
jgi:hypothetical protein